MMESGWKIRNMETELTSGMMATGMLESGKRTRERDKESFGLKIETTTKESGKMIKGTDWAPKSGLMEINMWAVGKTI